MYKREKFGMSFMLLIFVAFFFFSNGVNEKCRAYPKAITTLGIVMTCWYIARVIYKEKHNIKIDQVAPLNKEQVKSVISAIGLTFVYILLIRTIGYCVTTFFYVAGFSYWHTKTQKKWMYFVVSAGMTIFLYCAFGLFLKIPLPKGFLI